MLNSERAAAAAALTSGVYVTFRNTNPNSAMPNSLDFCARVSPASMCFCGHSYGEHGKSGKTLGRTRCGRCKEEGTACGNYEFMFSRPEEVSSRTP